MKFWGTVVAFLYILILVVLMGPLAGILFFSPEKGWKDFFEGMASAYSGFKDKEVWICLAIALISQAALLFVPVEMASRRPISKRSVIPLVLATSFARVLQEHFALE